MIVPEIQPLTEGRHPPYPQGLSEEAATALERELRAAIQGEVRFDAGTRALYATDGSNYRQVPIGVSHARGRGGCGGHRGRLPPARRAGAHPRRRHQPGRTVLQRRGGHGLFEVHEPGHRYRSGAKLRPRAARLRPRRAAQRGREVPPDLRSRPGHPQPLHAGRDAGQQLLRHPRARWPAATADNIARAGDPDLRRLPMRVGRTSDEELERIIRRGRPPRARSMRR